MLKILTFKINFILKLKSFFKLNNCYNFVKTKEKMKKFSNQYLFIFAAFISLATIYAFAPITQPQDYHSFAEQRHLVVPHVGDVLSNLAFVFAGVFLWIQSKKWNTTEIYNGQRGLFAYFCIGAVALGLGSGYYHWEPTDRTLAWDRAAMVLGFAVIFYDSCVRYKIFKENRTVVGSSVSTLVFLLTVLYWSYFERLEPYVFAQFFTMFALVVLAVNSYKEIPSRHLFNMFVWYALAKVFESNDEIIFKLTQEIVSGHTLKHIAYAVALYVFGKDMLKR